ncbi:MAG: GerW family sporulation protein, partial [Oscillospiraceae bacterium]
MGEKHPIEGIMYTAMQGLKDMIDVNTIVGEAVTTPDGSVIIPISKVAVGFGVGGSEFENAKNLKASATEAPDNMFGGGTGGGISLSPVAFLVVGGGQIRLIPVTA